MKMRLGWLALLAATQAAAQLVHSNYTDTQSMLWGAYRPNLYFGVRPRIPQSLMTGLMWYGTQDHQGSRCQLVRPGRGEWRCSLTMTWYRRETFMRPERRLGNVYVDRV
jgi:hypothetical protein